MSYFYRSQNYNAGGWLQEDYGVALRDGRGGGGRVLEKTTTGTESNETLWGNLKVFERQAMKNLFLSLTLLFTALLGYFHTLSNAVSL